MSIQVKNKYNELNIIIKTKDNKQIFFSDKDNIVKDLSFYVYAQCFNIKDKHDIDIFLIHATDNNSNINDIIFYNVGNYKLNKNGFSENDFSQIEKSNINITNNYQCDLHIDMNGIKLNEGNYEISAKIDNKIITICPFKIIKKF